MKSCVQIFAFLKTVSFKTLKNVSFQISNYMSYLYIWSRSSSSTICTTNTLLSFCALLFIFLNKNTLYFNTGIFIIFNGLPVKHPNKNILQPQSCKGTPIPIFTF